MLCSQIKTFKNHFVLIMCRHSTTFKWMDVCAPPNTVQLISRCWRLFSTGWFTAFQKDSNLWLGRAPPNTAHFFTVLNKLLVWMFCRHVKRIKFMAGPRSPTSLVTAQLISRRWRIISFWCYADMQQRSNERMVVLPQTRSCSFHRVKEPFRLDGKKRFNNIRTHGWVLLPQTRPSSFHGVEKSTCTDVLQPCKIFHV